MLLDKIIIASLIRSYILTWNRSCSTGKSFDEALEENVTDNLIDFTFDQYYQMNSLVWFTVMSKQLAIKNDVFEKNIISNCPFDLKSIFLNSNDSEYFDKKTTIKYIRNAICHGKNNYIIDQNGNLKMKISLNNTKATAGSKKGSVVPFNVEFSIEQFVEFNNIFEFFKINKTKFINWNEESKSTNEIIDSLQYKSFLYNMVSDIENEQLLKMLSDDTKSLNEFPYETANRLNNKIKNIIFYDYNENQKKSIGANVANWERILPGIEEGNILKYEALKATPNSFTKVLSFEILFSLLLKYNLKLPQQVLINELLNNTGRYKLFNKDESMMTEVVLNALDIKYQTAILYSLYFEYLLENIITDDEIKINSKYIKRERIRNSFVHGRWCYLFQKSFELFDWENGLKNDFNYDFHEKIDLVDLFNSLDAYYWKEKQKGIVNNHSKP